MVDGKWSASPSNNFNLLRLFFASLVVFCHSPEIIDGNRSREFLTMIFGAINSGEIAVDGFFLVSGYLICESFMRSDTTGQYLRKRILRIYPGFIVAYLICITIVAAWAGGTLPGWSQLLRPLLLAPPSVGHEFRGLHYASLNTPMWTIAFEFRCYILVIVLGALGAFRHRWTIPLAAAVLILLNATQSLANINLPAYSLFGDMNGNVRLTGVFLTGASFFLFKDMISYRGPLALACFLAMLPFLFFGATAEAAFTTLGGYVIFWFAFAGPFRSLSARLRVDVSYGLYLYAWPVQSLLIYHIPHIRPLTVTLVTLPTAALLGWLSWTFVEKPAKSAKLRMSVPGQVFGPRRGVRN